MKRVLTVALFLFAGNLIAQETTGEVVGEVVDQRKQAIYYAVATIESNGTKYQARTDYDGRFRISGIPAGEYLLDIIHEEDTMYNITVNVPIDGFDNLGVLIFEKTAITSFGPAVVTSNQVKIEYGFTPVAQMSAKEIAISPAKFDPKGLITAMTSDVRQTDDGELVFRGARKGDMVYMIDGIKSNEVSSVPSCAIGHLMVYTGGLPAKYGDTMGGVVVMETKSYFDLYRSWEAQQLMNGSK